MLLQELPARRRVTTPTADRAREIAATLPNLPHVSAFACGCTADPRKILDELEAHRIRLASRRIGLAGREARDLERLHRFMLAAPDTV